jgi:hypothetical protein
MSKNALTLRITSPDGQTSESRSDLESIILGSGAGAAVKLHDPKVSNLHVMLKVEKNGVVTAIDLGSEHGTLDEIRAVWGLEDRRELQRPRVLAVQVVNCCVHWLSLVGCGRDVPNLGIEARLFFRPDRGPEPEQATFGARQRALDQRVGAVDFAVVDEPAVDGGVLVVAGRDESLVEFRPLVVAGLSLLGDRRAHARGVPRAEVADPSSPSLAGVFALPLLDAPALDGALGALSFGDSADVEVLAVAEHVFDAVFAAVLDEVQRALRALLETAPAHARPHHVALLFPDLC